MHTVSTPVDRYGLLREQVTLQGEYILESVNQIFIAKAADIPVMRINASLDQLSDEESYQYSGAAPVGTSPLPHNVKALPSSDQDAMLANLDDVYAYASGWSGLNAAAYHPRAELTYRPGQVSIDSSSLAQSDTLEPPTAEKVRIDHRIGEIDVYRILSFFTLLPNGDLVLRHGAGAEIRLTGGGIEIHGISLQINAAKTVSMFSKQISIHGQQACEIVSSTGDVLIKSEQQLSMLGGNGGTGGVLIESRSASLQSNWQSEVDQSYGSGLVLKSASSHVSLLAGDVIIKTAGGSSGLRGGNILLDAGTNQIISRASTHARYATEYYADNFGTAPSNVDAVNTFSKDYNRLAGVTGIDGTLLVGGAIQAESHIVTSNGYFLANPQMVSTYLGRVVGVKDPSIVDNNISRFREQLQDDRQFGEDVTRYVRDRLETPALPANNVTIKNTSFGFPSSSKYGTTQLTLRQPYWQRKLSQGVTLWQEPTVSYREQQTRPWPGQATWEREDVFVQVDPASEAKYFDSLTATHKSPEKNRETYETAVLGDVQRVSLSTGFKTLRT